MQTFRFIVVAAVFATLLVMLVLLHHAKKQQYEVNQALRQTIQELNARIDELAQQTNGSEKTPAPHELSGELLRLRSEATLLRRHQDELLRQLATNAAAAHAVMPASDDRMWVNEVLQSDLTRQGTAAGALRGKLLRRETTNVSPAELLLQEELLKRDLNQTLERSPIEFAAFQTSFIQGALNLSNEGTIRDIRDLIQRTYEQAVAQGLDVASKPATGTEEWVERRFALDRAATAELQRLLTPEERRLFDRAFLGVMGVDLGGVGVDRSNYPNRFLGEP